MLAIAGYGDSLRRKDGCGKGSQDRSPLVLALLWSMMGSPKASIRLDEPYYFLFQLAMFGLPVVFLALLANGRAIGYGAVALLNLILMYVWKQ